MSWFKIDDQLHGHPKARRAGLDAMGLWVVAGSYSAAYKLDGHIDREWVASWPKGANRAAQLVKAGLWHTTGHRCGDCPQPDDPDGWVFHDWADQNPTSEEIEKKRDHDRERQRKRRLRLAGEAPDKEATPT